MNTVHGLISLESFDYPYHAKNHGETPPTTSDFIKMQCPLQPYRITARLHDTGFYLLEQVDLSRILAQTLLTLSFY